MRCTLVAVFDTELTGAVWEATMAGRPLYEPGWLEPERINPVLGTILLVVLVLLFLGVIPAWSHSRSWGYGPSGGLGLILVIVLFLVLTGRM
jgi:hypothetical protein